MLFARLLNRVGLWLFFFLWQRLFAYRVKIKLFKALRYARLALIAFCSANSVHLNEAFSVAFEELLDLVAVVPAVVADDFASVAVLNKFHVGLKEQNQVV